MTNDNPLKLRELRKVKIKNGKWNADKTEFVVPTYDTISISIVADIHTTLTNVAQVKGVKADDLIWFYHWMTTHISRKSHKSSQSHYIYFQDMLDLFPTTYVRYNNKNRALYTILRDILKELKLVTYTGWVRPDVAIENGETNGKARVFKIENPLELHTVNSLTLKEVEITVRRDYRGKDYTLLYGDKIENRCYLTEDILKQLDFDPVKAEEAAAEHCSLNFIQAGISEVQLDERKDKEVHLWQYNGYRPFHLSDEQVTKKMVGTSLQLFDFQGTVYLGDYESVTRNIRNDRRYSYALSVSDLSNLSRTGYASRNETNLRLDTNITNAPSWMLPFVTLDGKGLYQIDLKNSQPTMFAYELLKSTSFDKVLTEVIGSRGDLDKEEWLLGTDIETFIQLVQSGEFYEKLQQICELETRKDAKTVAFQVFFPSYTKNSVYNQIFNKHFPQTGEVIRLWKKNKDKLLKDRYVRATGEARPRIDMGSRQFAILLQKTESYIFIDRILNNLLNRGYKVLSKHDSILFTEDIRDVVYNEIVLVLNEFFGEGNYRLSEEKIG